jgi:ribosomal protein L7/L12
MFQSKELVEKLPATIKDGVNKDDCDKFLALLKEAGAVIDVN